MSYHDWEPEDWYIIIIAIGLVITCILGALKG